MYIPFLFLQQCERERGEEHNTAVKRQVGGETLLAGGLWRHVGCCPCRSRWYGLVREADAPPEVSNLLTLTDADIGGMSINDSVSFIQNRFMFLGSWAFSGISESQALSGNMIKFPIHADRLRPFRQNQAKSRTFKAMIYLSCSGLKNQKA